jgi:hypothetical protein
MKNKYKAKLKQRNKRFLDTLEYLTENFTKKYPDWMNGSDVNHIKKRLNQTAKIMTKNNKLKKIKVLKKEDFKEWPFITDKIIIMQTSKKMISCMIDLQEYALNGLAATYMKLKFPHDCGKIEKGKSVSEFIKIGLGL